MQVSTFPMLPHGRATAPRGDGARLLRCRQGQILPGQTIFTDCLRKLARRARDAAASMWRLRRNVVFGPTRHIGVSLRASPDAYTIECLIRARSWSTLRGELGATGPSLASLEYSLYLARRKHFKPCVSMIDDAERITSSYCGRWLVVDRSMMWPITDGR